MDQPACLMAKLADTPTMRKAVFPVQTMTITSSRTPTGRRNLHNPLPEQSMRGALCNIYGSGCQGFEIGREYLYTKRGDCALQDSAPTAATVPGKALTSTPKASSFTPQKGGVAKAQRLRAGCPPPQLRAGCRRPLAAIAPPPAHPSRARGACVRMLEDRRAGQARSPFCRPLDPPDLKTVQ